MPCAFRQFLGNSSAMQFLPDSAFESLFVRDPYKRQSLNVLIFSVVYTFLFPVVKKHSSHRSTDLMYDNYLVCRRGRGVKLFSTFLRFELSVLRKGGEGV